ncbi:hypothetical protein MNEG_12323, partial [Monoraphidium neglectum]
RRDGRRLCKPRCAAAWRAWALRTRLQAAPAQARPTQCRKTSRRLCGGALTGCLRLPPAWTICRGCLRAGRRGS